MTSKIPSKALTNINPSFTGNNAIFSFCRKYRYALWRIWDSSRAPILFIGLNPSTADEKKNDPTIRRCIGYAQDWGYGGLLAGNVFAYCATRPAEMKREPDPVGIENDGWLVRLTNWTDQVIGAWGNHGEFRNRFREIEALLPPLMCLGTTLQGHPRHPLYLCREAKPEAYTFPF